MSKSSYLFCFFVAIFYFIQDNCVKHSGSMQEGMEFEDNTHNSLEPRG